MQQPWDGCLETGCSWCLKHVIRRRHRISNSSESTLRSHLKLYLTASWWNTPIHSFSHLCQMPPFLDVAFGLQRWRSLRPSLCVKKWRPFCCWDVQYSLQVVAASFAPWTCDDFCFLLVFIFESGFKGYHDQSCLRQQGEGVKKEEASSQTYAQRTANTSNSTIPQTKETSSLI